MIDQNGRNRIADDRRTKTLVDGLKESVVAAVKMQKPADTQEDKDIQALMGAPFQEVLRLAAKKDTEKEMVSLLSKIGTAIAILYKGLPKSIVLPKIFQVDGKVEVTRAPDITIKNLSDLKEYFQSLEQRIASLSTAISSIPQSRIEVPKMVFPKDLFKANNKDILDALESLEKAIEKTGGKAGKQTLEMPDHISIDNFPPQMVPQPVTHISINASHGTIKTTAATVGSTLAVLPSYGVLANRRSIMVYNNAANTIFIGGSDVTTSNGMPVPAGAYSPILDFSPDMILYGIASTSGNNIRVMEESDEASGR